MALKKCEFCGVGMPEYRDGELDRWYWCCDKAYTDALVVRVKAAEQSITEVEKDAQKWKRISALLLWEMGGHMKFDKRYVDLFDFEGLVFEEWEDAAERQCHLKVRRADKSAKSRTETP